MPVAAQIKHSTAFSPFAAFAFEISIDLVEPMKFMSHFNNLNVFVIETLTKFQVICVGFVQ